MDDLAIVIVSYNVCELLRACLTSVRRASIGLRVGVFVVDNCSNDGSADSVARDFPDVRLIRVPRNLGYARANNLALREILADSITNPELILLLNPDTDLPALALHAMVAFMREHRDAGASGPRLLLSDGQLDLACRRSFPSPKVSFYRLTGLSRIFPRNPIFARYNLTDRDPMGTYPVDSVVGAFMLVRASVIRQIGLLDEQFFMYGEDLDWAYRIKQAGWAVYYHGAVSVLHRKRASSSQRNIQSIIAFYTAMWLFFQKHYAASTVWPARWLIGAAIWGRAGAALAVNALRAPATRPLQNVGRIKD